MSIAPCVLGGCSLFVQYPLTRVAKPQFDILITLRVRTGLYCLYTATLCSASSLRSSLSAYCVAGFLTLPQHRHHAPQSFQKAFYKQIEKENISDSYVYAAEKMRENFNFEDCKEGVKAFIEKRQAKYKY